MDLRQLTAVYACTSGKSICVLNFFVDQSSSRLLFGEDIPTSMEVIEAQTLNFKPNFKFLLLKFFGVPPSQLGCALGSLGQSLTRLKI